MGLVSQIDASGVRFSHCDGLGSIAAVTDLGGAIVEQSGFRGFGERSLELGAKSRAGFIGRYGVESAIGGVLFMRDRFYDAAIGAFLGQDPEVAPANEFLGRAAYLYALGNPVTQIDPDGRTPKPSKATKSKPPVLKRIWPTPLFFEGELNKVLPKSAVVGGVGTVGKSLFFAGTGKLTRVPALGTAFTVWSGRNTITGMVDLLKIEGAQRHLMLQHDWDADKAAAELPRRLFERGGMANINGVIKYNPKMFNDVYKEVMRY
jgi:RHS repeat-associated protein